MNQITINQLVFYFINNHAKLFKKSWRQDEKYIERYIKPTFGVRMADEIKRGEIELWHKSFNGHFLANRVLSLMCTIYNKGIDWELVANNPAKRIKKFHEKPRETFIPREDLPKFFMQLETCKPYFKQALKFMLTTGVRKKECINLKWSDVTKEYIHIRDRKNNDDLYIPMTEAAYIILSDTDRVGEYVFTNKGREQADYKNQWNKLRRNLKRVNFLNKQSLKFNDIRRTVGSYLGQNGANAKLIGEILGQRSIVSTQRYIRFQVDHIKSQIDKLPPTSYN